MITKIEWTDKTWNPIRGCSRVSEGCRNCYAEGIARRFSKPGLPYHGLIAKTGQWNGEIKFIEEKLTEPLHWKKRCRIFVNSMSDLFHENIKSHFIDKIMAVMAICEKHTFQVLTKRPEIMAEYFKQLNPHAIASRSVDIWGGNDPDNLYDWVLHRLSQPLPNLWLGVSVEDQETADKRIPYLIKTPAAVRWVSAEPLLGPVELISEVEGCLEGVAIIKSGGVTASTPYAYSEGYDDSYPGIDWVVVGGESGKGARPMQADWARSLRDQCQTAAIAYFFKQWGEYAPWMERVGKKRAGRKLDGKVWNEYPEEGCIYLDGGLTFEQNTNPNP